METYDLTRKLVITESDLYNVQVGSQVLLHSQARLTPLAQDFVKTNNLAILRNLSKNIEQLKIAIGADHGGFLLKGKLLDWFLKKGLDVQDFGTFDERPVDYPDIAHNVALAVKNNIADVGIIIDGAGIGSCMVANKIPGIRAAMCYDLTTAKNSREHNDANVLTLGAKMISEETATKIVEVWLYTQIFEERHIKRIQKIKQIELNYYQK